MTHNKHIEDLVNLQEERIAQKEKECIQKYGAVLRSNQPFFEEASQKLMCPPYFDTIYCWPPQLPNTTTSVPCPSYIVGFIPDQNATRRCLENGQWFTKNGIPFSNYSRCYKNPTITVFTNKTADANSYETFNAEADVTLIKVLSETGYAISLISLIIAFTIMFKIKKLHCARNILHMNLFASFILRSFMRILKDTLFEDGLGLAKDLTYHNGSRFFHIDSSNNNFECKLIMSLVQYFTAANYSWILMEGLYLNNLILRAMFTDSNKNLAYYITFGWGLPLLVVVPWVAARILVEDTYCWTTNDNFKVFAIIIIPTFASVLLNLVLFLIISVVLYNKLKSPINEDSRRYLKWAKSTLVLVPLFGVNYAVFLIFYFLDQKIIWMICDTLFGSFQGSFVAILYCFLNGEVKAEMKPYLNSLLIFLATNNVTKCCFPRREKYLSSAAGRQSVCTTMSCSSLFNNGLTQRSNKTKLEQLSKITNFDTETKESTFPNGVRHSVPKVGNNGHYMPNFNFVHGKYPLNMTTNNLDLSLSSNEIRPHHYSQNLPTCEEEVSMLTDTNVHINLESNYEN